jgi:hypothetical protein
MNSDACTVLMERFPKLGLLTSTWDPIETAPEKAILSDLSDVKLLYVYGLGEGEPYFQCKEWLEGHEHRHIIFLEDEPGAIASFLYRPESIEVLSHPRVHLELISKGRRRLPELQQIAESFPARKIDVVSLPSRKTPSFRSLRLSLLRKATITYGLHLDRLQGHRLFEHFVQNVKHLPRAFYANSMKNAFKDTPAIICGAGPSLQAAIPYLREYQDKVLMIGGGSTLAALSSQGIIPHFGMAIDPNQEEFERLRNSFAFEMPLLFSTRVLPTIFNTCNGPFGYMRTGIGGVPELWLEEQLKLTDPLIGDHLTLETMSVTSICLAWAQHLGCNPIFLAGVDLAYTGKKRYASGVAEEESFEDLEMSKGASDQIVKRKNRLGNPVYTAVRWVMESACMSHFAKKHPEIRFVNTTPDGLGFKHIPYHPLEEMLQEHCSQPLHLRSRVAEAISRSPMPENTATVIEEGLREMRESLDRMVGYLEVLWKEKSEGRRVLAEIDLREEMAYLYLFYDAEDLFREEDEKWRLLYEQARMYQRCFKRN